jgi:hypothetical protein
MSDEGDGGGWGGDMDRKKVFRLIFHDFDIIISTIWNFLIYLLYRYLYFVAFL